MEGHRGHSSLTRTRSSIHSLVSIHEDEGIGHEEGEEKKPHRTGSGLRVGPRRWRTPVPVLVSLVLLTLFFFYFFYLGREEISTSENLLLVLVLIAVSLFFASKNKGAIHQSLAILKQLRKDRARRLGFSKTHNKSVQWFIGESAPKSERKEKKIAREGVEFFGNGDFYEGEFHNGRCHGSGVYNYFVSGRYEGDWMDGKYDGYGIESWARGSRYRGQYRQGLRHGLGVYRFYSGDSYAGEWFHGQSHGVGVQTCSDGSCYLGEFKRGFKHGLGCYHFR